MEREEIKKRIIFLESENIKLQKSIDNDCEFAREIQILINKLNTKKSSFVDENKKVKQSFLSFENFDLSNSLNMFFDKINLLCTGPHYFSALMAFDNAIAEAQQSKNIRERTIEANKAKKRKNSSEIKRLKQQLNEAI
ncbi:MAG: hypothetical protein MR823_07145 [Ruminococcus sp.]|nr:hypothetical protein [Ruminococcus sp.]MDY4910088.1 hypothetical protein [Candidatus Fimenecus sp.]